MRWLAPLFILAVFVLNTNAQDNCKVLQESINSSYSGDCKKGLAHGKGLAKGKDQYQGNFKKGLPHGQGTYTYAEGDTYKGGWKQGQRFGKGTFESLNSGKYIGNWKADMKEGEGTYHLKINDIDTVLAGLWKEDKYLGPKPEKPYKIVSNRGIDRISMFKIRDGNRLMVKVMQNGSINSSVQDFRFVWSSGTETSLGGMHEIAWENMEYPFEGRISYSTSNKLGTARFTVTMEFIINEPGNWELILHN